MSVLIFIIIIAVIVYKLSKKQEQGAGNRTNQRMWSEAAHSLNLNLHSPNAQSVFPSMSGMIDGMSVEVWGDFDEGGFALVFCRVDFARELPFRLSIVKGDFEKSPAGSSFEIQGLPSGVSVTASDGNALQKFLVTQNVNVLKNCTGIYHSVKITDSFLILGATGINTGTTLESFIERAVSAAKTLSGGMTVSAMPGAKPASPKPNRPVMPTAIPVAEEVPPPEVVILPPPEEKKEPVIPVPKPVDPPKKPEMPLPEPKPVQKAEPALQEESAAELDLSAESLAKALFSASFPGEKEKALFSQQIGKTVQWCGTLKSVYPYSSDFVFGKGPGVKATFEICEVSSGYGMKHKIKATVSFGEDAMAVLKGKNGETFNFTGTLLKMESFAREILLEKGSLNG